jgi:hypothetical protein
MKRRQTLKILSTLPIVAAFPSVAFAGKGATAKKGGMPLIDEKDTLASAMQYKHDASQAGPVRTDKKANCMNCAKYNVCMDGDTSCKPLSKADLAKATQGPCQIFKGKAVAAKGWCLSWQAKG